MPTNKTATVPRVLVPTPRPQIKTTSRKQYCHPFCYKSSDILKLAGFPFSMSSLYFEIQAKDEGVRNYRHVVLYIDVYTNIYAENGALIRPIAGDLILHYSEQILQELQQEIAVMPCLRLRPLLTRDPQVLRGSKHTSYSELMA